MNEGDNPPIGIVLCADKSDTLVEYTLPEDLSYYVKKYKLKLPKAFVDDMINNDWKINISINDLDLDDIEIEY